MPVENQSPGRRLGLPLMILLMAGTAAQAEEIAYAPLSSKHPYIPPVDATYSTPPAGYAPFMIEHVARHGSRLLSSAKYDDLSLQLWEMAKAEGALTPAGETFGPLLEKITAYHQKAGYGNLSALGAQEHIEIAKRTAQRMKPLFDAAEAENRPIDILSSGKDRAVDSSESFVAGLIEADPALKPLIGAMVVDPRTLYFHDTDVAYNAYKDDDPHLKATLDALSERPDVAAAARDMLERIYTPAFVDKLQSGAISFVDHGKGKAKLDDISSAADSLYNLYIIGPGVPEEHWDFSAFVPTADAEVMAEFSDGEQFYEKGPGFAGSDITYGMAAPLLQDFFDRIDARIDGKSQAAATFRFAHAEEIMPFAALIKAPGSTLQASAAEPYSHANNPWRGTLVTPMAANVQWDVFSNDTSSYLVRMLYNEREVPFQENCRPIAAGSMFYELTELESCLPTG
jgi:hypothetical protein